MANVPWIEADKLLHLPAAVEARYWAKVTRGPSCWIWTGARSRNRGGMYYGSFNLPATALGAARRTVRAHKLSYLMHHGPVPDGLIVRHSCDQPLCVNPAHLLLGTHADSADRDRRGRHRVLRGEDHPRTLLTAAQARAIRESYAEGGIPIRRLAQQYGVSEQPITSILHGTTHPDAGGPAMPRKRAPNARLALHDYAAIRRRDAAGERRSDLAAEYGVHPGTIKRIVLQGRH